MEYEQTLTLNLIRKHGPCEVGWRKLLAGLGKTKADDEPLTIAEIYRINGFDDALWCLRALPDDRLSRHVQAWCAERVLHIFEAERPGDMRVRAQIAMLWNDDAESSERAAAKAAAWAATADAESDAARRDAAKLAAWAAAWAAASSAESDAASSAEWAATSSTAMDEQERQFRKMIGIEEADNDR